MSQEPPAPEPEAMSAEAWSGEKMTSVQPGSQSARYEPTKGDLIAKLEKQTAEQETAIRPQAREILPQRQETR